MHIETEAQTLTVKEIIELRVRVEIERYNKRAEKHFFNGLVAPTEAEITLNGYKLKPGKSIDAEKQCYVALDAFQKNGFFMLVNNKQVEDLNETFVLTPQTKISFVKLTPLIGG